LPVLLATDTENLNNAGVFGLDGLVGFCCAGKGGEPGKKSVEIIR
jgi:hypothetical protein